MLAEQSCVEVEALFCEGDGNFESGREGDKVVEEGDELVGFTLAESGSGRKDAEEKRFEAGQGNGVCKRS